ncbi:MAG: CBS domain-containing protein [Desulfacinum sp.]|nr:CBS domain-containing protein [Desulfacinum sp.]
MRLEDIMTRRLETISADASVYEAIERMVDKRIRSLLVVADGPVETDGVVTARDVVFKVLAKGLNPHNVRVGEIAGRPLRCVDKDQTVEAVAAVMEEANVARVFVCDEGRVVGVVALMDIMQANLVARAKNSHA